MEGKKHKEKNIRAFPGSSMRDHLGMTLRDYFAAKAMNGYMYASLDVIAHGMPIDAKTISEESYKIADAMLKTREDV